MAQKIELASSAGDMLELPFSRSTGALHTGSQPGEREEPSSHPTKDRHRRNGPRNLPLIIPSVPIGFWSKLTREFAALTVTEENNKKVAVSKVFGALVEWKLELWYRYAI